MNTDFINTIGAQATEVGHFLFETFAGIAILVGGCLLITLLIAVLMEFRTRKRYKDHEIDQDTEAEATDA